MRRATVFIVISVFLVPQIIRVKSERVLFINSYNSSFPTYFQQIEGLRSVMDTAGVIVDIESMDAKRFNSDTSAYLFNSSLKYKFNSGIDYDLILAADDLAFNYALSQKDSLFSNVPIVFFGVNDVEKAILQNKDPQITGIIEDTSIKETLDLIQQLFPNSIEIIVISDNTISGKALLVNFRKVIETIKNKTVKELLLSEMDYRVWVEELRLIHPETPVLLLSALKDTNGSTMGFNESLKLIKDNLDAPIFHLWNHGIDHGILGGKVVSQREQAKQAALKALRILRGENVSNFKVVKQSPNRYIFNYKELKKFNIRLRELPNGATFYGKPNSFISKYKSEIFIGLLFVIFQSIFILYLLITIKKRARSESQVKVQMEEYHALNKDYHKANEELRDANVYLKDAEIKLKKNMKELARKKDELKISEERFRLAIAGANEGLWDWNMDTNEIYFSDRWKEMLGFKNNELDNEFDSWKKLLHPSDVTETLRKLDDLIKGKTDVYETQFRMLHKSGRELHILSRGLAMKKTNNKVYRIIGTHIDLTERFLYEQKLREQMEENLSLYEEYRKTGEELNKKNNYLLKVEEELREYISKLNKKNVELAESEEKYRYLFDNLSEAFVLFEMEEDISGKSIDYIIREVNPQFLETNGVVYEDIIGRKVSEIFPEKLSRWVEKFSDVAKTGQSVKLEDYDYELNKYFEIRAFSPKKMFFAGIFNDITESVHAKEELLAEKERNDYILVGTNAGTWDLNLRTSQIIINKKWAELIGYTLSELEPLYVSDVFGLMHPKDRDYVNAELKKVKNDKGYNYDVEFRLEHKKGHWVWMHSRGSIVEYDQSDKPVRMAGTHLDISKEKKVQISLMESEKRFKTIFDKSKTIMLIIDPKTKMVVDANDTAVRFYGHNKEELIGMPMGKINIMDNDGIEKALQEASNEKKNSFRFKHVLKSGEIRDIDTYSSPIVVNNEKLLHSINIDVTGAVEAEDQIQQVNKRFVGLEKIIHYKADSINDLLDFTLKQILDFTSSDIGAVYHYNADKGIFYLNNWSETVDLSHNFNSDYESMDCLSMAAKLREPVIINNPKSKYPFQLDGLSNGETLRSITIPVIAHEKVVSLFWLATKDSFYSKFHAKQMMLLLDTAWILVERQRLQDQAN